VKETTNKHIILNIYNAYNTYYNLNSTLDKQTKRLRNISTVWLAMLSLTMLLRVRKKPWTILFIVLY